MLNLRDNQIGNGKLAVPVTKPLFIEGYPQRSIFFFILFLQSEIKDDFQIFAFKFHPVKCK